MILIRGQKDLAVQKQDLRGKLGRRCKNAS